MINPAEVTNYNRTQSELQEFLLFCINVAGKKSAVEAPKLEVFLERAKDISDTDSPFDALRALEKAGRLQEVLHWASISPYKQRYNSYKDVLALGDLQAVTLARLMQVRGVGLKTARFFLSHSREDFDEPMLDTHILRFLRDQGYRDAPKSTPQNQGIYNYYSNVFKMFARTLGKSVTDLDLEIWKQYSKTE
jgi:thermostable 8-oxoguanine DNA glycosylase